MQAQTEKLQPFKISIPTVETNPEELLVQIQKVARIDKGAVNMENKKLCFFGDTNKVMILNVAGETWQVKSIQPNGCEFLYYSAAVTLPNGDALITGGGSSSNVYQYQLDKNRLIQLKSMNQMRKEHAAVINQGQYVYVMGGYDGAQNHFLNCCEVYNIQTDQWKYFAPMNISKCAFSATIVNKKYIYTFGGYDG